MQQIFFFFALSIFLAVNVNAGPRTLPRFKPNELIIKYKDGVRRGQEAMETIYNTARVEKIRRFHGILKNFEHVKLQENTDVRQMARTISSHPAVEYAQPNYVLRIFDEEENEESEEQAFVPRRGRGESDNPCWWPGFPPGCEDPAPQRPPVADKPADVDPPVTDPNLSLAYGLEKIGSYDAWKVSRGSQKIVVAVIDTGIDYNHEDLAFNMWRNPNPTKGDLVGWDFIHNDNLPFDDHMHGTHVAGTIGGVGGNGKGVSGVSPRVSLMALKFLSGQGYGDTTGAIQAIDYAIQNGAKISNNSWGGGADENNQALKDAITRAEKAGHIFVAAAGNDATDNDKSPTYPAAFNLPNMLTVAATDQNDKMARFSNYGAKSVHLAAPGVEVYSSIPGNAYRKASGTSMATPHVAGATALLWSLNPQMTFQEVRTRMLESVDGLDILNGKTITGGRLNVGKAVKKLASEMIREGRGRHRDRWN